MRKLKMTSHLREMSTRMTLGKLNFCHGLPSSEITQDPREVIHPCKTSTQYVPQYRNAKDNLFRPGLVCVVETDNAFK